ncbi:hypothetical protein PROFUN_04092 [Planoprotostelium fungivorum]|uniref:Uncharacterized protein n=1 Tax=Planoprotostelium fungivorum TaxID=1890364 RepID=A0A2P6NJH7_9EUKA|nr:hypothetical protein PROFUN_04092 [Planoprotostelium fungivorum]
MIHVTELDLALGILSKVAADSDGRGKVFIEACPYARIRKTCRPVCNFSHLMMARQQPNDDIDLDEKIVQSLIDQRLPKLSIEKQEECIYYLFHLLKLAEDRRQSRCHAVQNQRYRVKFLKYWKYLAFRILQIYKTTQNSNLLAMSEIAFWNCRNSSETVLPPPKTVSSPIKNDIQAPPVIEKKVTRERSVQTSVPKTSQGVQSDSHTVEDASVQANPTLCSVQIQHDLIEDPPKNSPRPETKKDTPRREEKEDANRAYEEEMLRVELQRRMERLEYKRSKHQLDLKREEEEMKLSLYQKRMDTHLAVERQRIELMKEDAAVTRSAATPTPSFEFPPTNPNQRGMMEEEPLRTEDLDVKSPQINTRLERLSLDYADEPIRPLEYHTPGLPQLQMSPPDYTKTKLVRVETEPPPVLYRSFPNLPTEEPPPKKLDKRETLQKMSLRYNSAPLLNLTMHTSPQREHAMQKLSLRGKPIMR